MHRIDALSSHHLKTFKTLVRFSFGRIEFESTISDQDQASPNYSNADFGRHFTDKS